ncbi:MAG: RNA-binding domain-containing protein [Candidatus Bathyarchaeia archaeon]
MDEVTVRIEAEVNPTEDEEKVKVALENLFGCLNWQLIEASIGYFLVAESKGQNVLVKLRDLFRNDRIRDAARKVLFGNLHGKTIVFCLNKQVAFAGHVSFSEEVAESPLGPVKVIIECENPRELIGWLAPRSS